LVCSVAGVLDDLFDLGCSPADLVALTRRAENDFAGAPTGGMDQLISVSGQAGHALLCDMRSLEVEQVPFDPAAAGLTLLVIDTKAPHGHVEGEYGARRRSCEQAAQVLGVPALRDVTADGLDEALARLRADGGDQAEVLVKRTRHIVTENARVLATVALLRDGRIRDIGPLLTASQASMRDDFEVSAAQVDLVVETALAHGALGSRMTGGGFGGCVISLVETDQVGEVAGAVRAAFAEHGFDPPAPFTAVATDGIRLAGTGVA
jgi:galactokinase